ncbi:hypothetical protein Nepgr_006346 [Nepenthes gracilis]|uniref:Transmembrane protein n=1 Tax=Nepenthes gracilis TaxID=150966 RepID=A0AAD3S588_NEPGR|nr:hypothetical protein Nepgr_006346 [Nepenthes gracilis]
MVLRCEIADLGFCIYLNHSIPLMGLLQNSAVSPSEGFDFAEDVLMPGMSGGTPTGGNFMRQRHSWGYASSGDDLEDDACSKLQPQTPSIPRARSWIEVMENVLWIASAAFIIYFGDWHFNLIYLLWHDNRIRRMPLFLGLAFFILNAAYFFYTSMSAWGVRKYNEKLDVTGDSALAIVTLGLISFCMFTLALWPIWSFLTLPLVFTLLMACMVVSPYLVIGTFKPQANPHIEKVRTIKHACHPHQRKLSKSWFLSVKDLLGCLRREVKRSSGFNYLIGGPEFR